MACPRHTDTGWQNWHVRLYSRRRRRCCLWTEVASDIRVFSFCSGCALLSPILLCTSQKCSSVTRQQGLVDKPAGLNVRDHRPIPHTWRWLSDKQHCDASRSLISGVLPNLPGGTGRRVSPQARTLPNRATWAFVGAPCDPTSHKNARSSIRRPSECG